MKSATSALTAYLDRLNARERRLLLGGVGLVGLTLLWLLHGWQAGTHRKLDSSLPQAHAQLDHMQAEAAEIARLRGLPQAPSQPLAQHLTVLQTSASTRGLALTLKSDGNQIIATGQKVPFDNLIQWLGETERNSGTRPTYLDITPSAGGPAVEVRLAPAS